MIGGWFEARLTILHVHNQVFVPAPGMAMPPYSAELLLSVDERERLLGAMREFAAPAAAAGQPFEVVLESGAAVERILAASANVPQHLG